MPFGVMLITRKKDSAGETKMTDAKAVNGGEAQEINKHVEAMQRIVTTMATSTENMMRLLRPLRMHLLVVPKTELAAATTLAALELFQRKIRGKVLDEKRLIAIMKAVRSAMSFPFNDIDRQIALGSVIRLFLSKQIAASQPALRIIVAFACEVETHYQ